MQVPFIRLLSPMAALAASFNVAANGPTPGVEACAALAASAVSGTSLVSEYAAATELPAHCIVKGASAPRLGRDGKVYVTRFELRLPTTWSGRFFYQGGGGNDGAAQPAVGRNTGAFGDTALSRGFAVVSTNAGHDGATPEFGLDPIARIDHAHAAHERTARAAKTLIARYYGRPAGHSYFIGCSGGGRQGMMFAQRYPDYFDGIVACAPAMSVASRATIAAAWDTIAFHDIAPTGADGRKVLSRAFSQADLDLAARGILASCDAADGLVDGMVQNVAACRFDPATLACPSDAEVVADSDARASGAACLSRAQAAALSRAFEGPRDSAGRALYVGQPWDPGIAAPGWRMWKLGNSETATPNAANTTLMAGALAFEFFTPPDPAFSILDFDFDRDPARTAAFSLEYDTYRDASLAAFKARGGKLLIFHGAADGIFSALESVDYYQRLSDNNGGEELTARWARLFLVPGMNHCAAGPATDSFDGLAAIVDWVEQGKTPERVMARALPGSRFFPGRSRPLCPYPAYARYRGSGDPEDSASFICTQ